MPIGTYRDLGGGLEQSSARSASSAARQAGSDSKTKSLLRSQPITSELRRQSVHPPRKQQQHQQQQRRCQPVALLTLTAPRRHAFRTHRRESWIPSARETRRIIIASLRFIFLGHRGVHFSPLDGFDGFDNLFLFASAPPPPLAPHTSPRAAHRAALPVQPQPVSPARPRHSPAPRCGSDRGSALNRTGLGRAGPGRAELQPGLGWAGLD